MEKNKTNKTTNKNVYERPKQTAKERQQSKKLAVKRITEDYGVTLVSLKSKDSK